MSRERVTPGRPLPRKPRFDREASEHVGPAGYAIAGVDVPGYETPTLDTPWVVRARRNRSRERHYVKPTTLP